MSGWIKSHRSLLDWEWWSDHNTSRLFIYLLHAANYKPSKWRGRTIQAGQLLTGRKKLAIEVGISEQSVRTSLERLKSTGEVAIQSTSQYSIITVCNYTKYQEVDLSNNQQDNQPANKPTTSVQPASNHIQEDQEIKKKKKKESNTPLPPDGGSRSKAQLFADVLNSRSGAWLEVMPTHTLESWITFRKELGKPLTPTGLAAILNKFALDPSEFVRQAEQSISNGWQGLFPLKDQGGAYGKPKAYEGSSHRDALKRQLAEIRAKQGLKTENEDFL